MIKAQECNLEAISDNSDVLVLGGGTGNFLNKLLSRNNGCRIWYVEASQKMIERAKKNLNFTDRIIFIHGTHENLPEQKFDVVITHFFVDLFTEQELRAVSHQIHNHLKKEGQWLVADFVNRKYWHRVLLKLMYLFFNLMGSLDLKELPDWNNIIQAKYFEKASESTFYKDFICAVTYVKL
ncbi:MAG: class I SAM-dependent methyltransferase [Cyclobacteriaceae bacterium]